MGRPTRAIIDLDALRHNYTLAQSLSGAGQAMPIVKANAYGHGAIEVARALEPLAPALGVACIEEAVTLREAGVDKPILLLEGFFHEDEIALAAAQDFWLMVENDFHLAALDKARPAQPVTCWIKLDTGMHRLGFEAQRAGAVYRQLQGCASVSDGIVIATHLASADHLDQDFTERQLELFGQHTRELGAPRSIANSPGLLGWPHSRAEWNRPGVMLYGHSPFPTAHPEADKLRPVMTLRSEVMALRDIAAGEAVGYGNTWIAERDSKIITVPIGYGDGYPRHAAHHTPVLVNGQRAPLVGRVSMDMITVDVTGLPPVQLGDEVILWGDELRPAEIAGHAETIGYEIVTRTQGRVTRVYRG